MKWIALLLFCVGCGDEAQPLASGDAEFADPASGLTGVWTTNGVDETFGAVEVEMALEVDGRLRMVLLLASGGSRSFPGTWELDADELVLRGVYFAPDGESRVRWTLEDAVLVLEDAAGQRQQWRRRV